MVKISEAPVHPLNFRDVVGVIARQKKIVFGFLLIGLSVSLLYVVFQVPRYTAEIVFSAPSEEDISPIKLVGIGVAVRTPAEIYFLFKRQLASETTQKKFLEKSIEGFIGHEVFISLDQVGGRRINKGTGEFETKTISWDVRFKDVNFLLRAFSDTSITLRVSSLFGDQDFLSLEVVSWNPEITIQVAKALKDYVAEKLLRSEADNVRAGIVRSVENIESVIEFKKIVATKEKEDRISLLREAARMAKKLQIADPENINASQTIIKITPPEQFFIDPDTAESGSATSSRSHSDPALLQQDVYNPPVVLLQGKTYLPMYRLWDQSKQESEAVTVGLSPLFARGTKLLNAEIEFLENQSVESFLIPNLRQLQEEVRWLRQLKINEGAARPFGILEEDHEASEVRSPKPLLVMLLGALAGLISGLLLVLVRHTLQMTLPSGARS